MTRNSKKTLKSIIALILVAVLFTAIFFTIKHFDDEKNIPKKEQATQNKNDSASASSAIEIRINILEDHIASTQSQLKALSENTEDNNIALIQKMNELSKQLLEAQSALSFLTEEFNQSTLTTEEYYKLNLARIQSIEDSLIEIRANMSELTTIKNKIQILEENIKALIERLDNMVGEPGEVEAIRQQLAVVEAEYNLLLTDVDSNTTEIQKIKNQIDILNSKLSNISNPNILINGDFKINQRGKTSLSNIQSYFVDRWQFLGEGEGLSVSISDGSIKIVNTSNNLTAYFCQSVEFPERYSNQTFSISAKVLEFSGSPSFYIYDGTVEKQEINNTGVLSTTKTTSSNISIFRATFAVPANSSLTISWAKLEAGSVSTLYSPKSYSEEFLACQRYYSVIGKSGWEIFGNGVNSSSTKSTILILLPVEMRVRPKFSYSGNFRLIIGGNAPSVSKLENDIYASSTRVMCIDAISTGLSTSNSASILGANNSNAKLIFDAEL